MSFYHVLSLFRPRQSAGAARLSLLRPLLLLGAALLLFAALPARTGTLDAAQIQEKVFPSGLRLIVKEAHAAPLAAVQVWIRAGGFLEDVETAGTAHAIEHLVFKGTESGGPGSIDEEIENMGGLLFASTEKDWTQFGCTVASRHVEKVLGVVGDALRNAKFRAEDLEAERPILLEEAAGVRSNPELAVHQMLYSMAYRKHPYQFDVRGTREFINRMDLNAVRAYYERHYVPSNMVVVVVGDVDAAQVEKAVQSAFQADRPVAAKPQSLPEPERPGSRPERQVVPVPFPNGVVGIAFPAPSVKDEPDVHAMDVLVTLLEHNGIGRLPRALRGQGGVTAGYTTRRQAGLLTILAVAPPGSLDAVEALIRKELDFIRTNGIPEAELTLAKRLLMGSYQLDNEPNSGQAATLGYYAAIDRWQFASEYPAKVQAVTAAQVQDVVRSYLNPETSVTVVLKPESAPPAAPRPETRNTRASPPGVPAARTAR